MPELKTSFDISKLTPVNVTYAIFFITSTISPGFVYFYLFNYDFFMHADWIKLLFLSAGITLPFLIFNTLVLGTLKSIEKDDYHNIHNVEMPYKYFQSSFIMACWITLIEFYMFMAARYLFLKDWSSKGFFLLLVSAEGLFFASMLWKIISYNIKKNRQKKAGQSNK